MRSSKTITMPAVDGLSGLPTTPGRWLDSLRRYFFFLIGKAADSNVRLCLGVLFIFAFVFMVYSPVLPGSFLMDDHRLIKEDNPLVNGALTPLNIWFQTDFTLSSFALWLQWLAWGENPAWYHAVNMALHGLSAVLLWRLLARLKIPGAWLAAAMFAIHPVCVNSVARIAEIKNTLSLPFFILSFWFYLRYESISLNPTGQNPIARHRWRDPAALWYGLSLMAFVLALLSKTSTGMLPMLLLGCALWQRGRITRQDMLQTSPYFVLALGFGLMSVWFQKHQALVSAGMTPPHESFLERLAIGGRVVWFYLGKALLPVNLNLVYPRWKMDAATPAAFLTIIALCAGLVLCWRFRREWGRHVLFGLGCFAVTLFPALGFFDAQFLTRWQVSDHLQYLPIIAPLTLVAAGLASLPGAKMFRCAAFALVLTLSVLTFQRAEVFSTGEGLLHDTLAKNPAAWVAQNDLGVILATRGDYSGAVQHFVAAVQSNPDDNLDKAQAKLNLGQALSLQGKLTEAEARFLEAIKIKGEDSYAHQCYAKFLSRQGRNREAVIQLKVALSLKPDNQTRLDLAAALYQTGDFRQAASQFREAVSINPNQPESLNNLAWLLATCSDDRVRNGKEAIRYAQRACNLTGFKQTGFISTLAAAYAEAGRFSEAVATAEMAVKLQTSKGETRLAGINTQLLSLYRAGKPYHES